jgi:uroporphyrinogen decarboxylase
MIYPYHKITCDAVRRRNGYLSLHSDGNVSLLLDGIAELGYQVVHPYQASAGMDLERYQRDYKDRFVLMGGIDVQTTIGFGNLDRLKTEIEQIVGMFRSGGLLLCTSHYVQAHCSIEELTFAYDLIYDLVREAGRE